MINLSNIPKYILEKGFFYNLVEQLEKDKLSKFALYGAGKHSVKLITFLKSFNLRPDFIVDDNPPKVQIIMGISAIRPNKLTDVEATLVISSDTYEKELFAKAQEFWQGPIIKIYDLDKYSNVSNRQLYQNLYEDKNLKYGQAGEDRCPGVRL
ncbi:MAG: hypothetical protein HRT88_09990 [Lentisphaeraceae bacterium]|nr:hypothetical protein [Lentisphaeraceae bacterium]